MKLLFIMNPSSGRTSNDEVVHHIKEQAEQLNFDYTIHFTTGNADDKAIKKVLEDYSPDRVAACGGDGTVQLVAKTLVHTDIPMGILPLGSANGLARALALPKNYEEAFEHFIHATETIPLDLLLINDKYICTHLSDIGTNAILVKSYEEAGDKGMLGYAKHLLASIQQSDLMRFDIHTSQGIVSKEGYMLVIANAHKYGTGVQISNGSVSDGRFEICNVQRIDLESVIKAGLTAMNIFIDPKMFSDVISCNQAKIKITPQAHLQIDGEYIGEVTELKIDIISAALKIFAGNEE